jgi:hypothetical protein
VATSNDMIRQMIASGQMTDAQAKQIFTQAGVNVVPGEGRIDQYLAANPQVDMMIKGMLGGVSDRGSMPIGIEPIHQYERGALTSLGENPFGAGTALMNPQFMQMMDSVNAYAGKADSAVQQGMRGFDAAEMQQYMNPYTDQVINRSTARLSEEGERMKQAMIDSLSKRGSATMGDTFGAQQMGDISKELVSKSGDIISGLSYQGWTDALAQQMAQRERALQGGQIYAGMMNPFTNAAGTAQNATLDAQRLGLQTLGAQAGAGQRIQDFNQGVADITMADYMGGRNFSNTLTDRATTLFPGIQSAGTAPVNYQAQPNTLAMAGAGLSTLGQNWNNWANTGAGRVGAAANTFRF